MTVLNMELGSDSKTPLQKFYAGQNVLVTGGTGFLGKLLIEKLLRSCPDLSSIFVVIRPKKGQDAYHRLDTLFDDTIFDRLKKDMPKFRHKVTVIAGDCSLPGLGISQSDKQLIIRDVNIVFHVAATVKFDEKIKQAVAINVSGTKEMLDLSRQIQGLKVIIHVSTAYSNCNRMHIDEKFYDPPLSGDNAIKLVQSLDDKKLDSITPIILGDFPNTYAYTKCIAEQVVQQYGRDLPTGIFRPAVVISTYHEPVAGWIDNIYGPTGALVGGGAGLIRTMNMDGECVAELIPADLTVNALIATAWDVANSKNEDSDPPIYNYHSSWSKGLTWRKYVDLAYKYGTKKPSIRSIWCYSLTATKNVYLYYILSFLLHIVPAFLVDVGLFLTGKEPKMLKIYKKIHKFSAVTTYFIMRKWEFTNDNMVRLWDKLSSDDKQIYYFSMKNIDWDDYMQKCVDGLRLYIFKDDPNNIQMARKRMAKIIILHKVIKYTIMAFCVYGFFLLISLLFSINVSTVLAPISEHISIR
ncbi:fatty acyl-CoA reductase wat-like [Phymastichus coffea]|uniref:fatty acyl-CoA reductase wat-like n=1 Tax=Phymastichus coffea TaxID=108790 RepID=UPI00273A8E1E|nr:fatty acyl-CoA reductase wat-like [Phymastichus coffea]XP_058793399.1 fatty acyl-CoA reductase wat-like [Phymastichus coffea]